MLRSFDAKAEIVALVPHGIEQRRADAVSAGNEEPSDRVLRESAELVQEI